MSDTEIVGEAYFQCEVCKDKVTLPIRRSALSIKIGGLWRVVYQHKDHALMLFLDESFKVRNQASGSVSRVPEPYVDVTGEVKVTILDPRLFENFRYFKGFNLNIGEKRIQGIHRIESGTIVTVKEGDVTLEFLPTDTSKIDQLMQEFGTLSAEFAQLEVFPDAYVVFISILLLEENIDDERKLKGEHIRGLLESFEQQFEFQNYNDFQDFHEPLFQTQYPNTSFLCAKMSERPHSPRELIENLSYAYVRELTMMVDHLKTLGYLV